ncbi:MAG: DUF58 domain-containing protein [Methanomicrobium sp.]|nr:DUF58 domain-containing protein [Methanomicrobium sp.]
MKNRLEFLTLLIVILFAAGLFFRETKAVFAGFCISLLLLIDFFILNIKTIETASSLSFSRAADKTIISRGTGTGIKTEYEFIAAEGTQIQTEDVIPKGAFVTEGSTKSEIMKKSGKYSLIYEIICQSHGINRFEGIILSVSDNFFSRKIYSMQNSIKQTEIKVFPKPSFIRGGIFPVSGKNTDKPTLLQGDDIKGLREYNEYDDTRKIDWKASAKYDKLYIKDFGGLETDIQTLFIDLPDSEEQESEDKIELLKAAAASVLMNRDKNSEINIIGISGANVKTILKSKSLSSDIFDLMNSVKAVPRDKYLYNYSPKQYSGKGDEKTEFGRSLKEKKNYYFSIKSMHIFEKQIYNLLENTVSGKEIFVIAMSEGDISHLRILCSAVKMKKIRSFCFVPENNDIKSSLSRIYSCGFDEVKII